MISGWVEEKLTCSLLTHPCITGGKLYRASKLHVIHKSVVSIAQIPPLVSSNISSETEEFPKFWMPVPLKIKVSWSVLLSYVYIWTMYAVSDLKLHTVCVSLVPFIRPVVRGIVLYSL